MPKYYYHCNSCDENFFAYHLMSETQDNCNVCQSGDIKKLLTKPLFFDNKNQKSKTGELTKQNIEDNRKILEDMKKEAKNIDYDKT